MQGSKLSIVVVAAIAVVQAAQYMCPEICTCDVLTIATDCSGNELEAGNMPKDIYRQVVILDLSRNNFNTIPQLSQYQDLRILNMSFNKLTTLTRISLQGLTNLDTLDLSRNLFTHWANLNRLAFKPTRNLRELRLSHNPLGAFPEIYGPLNIPSLKVLRLTNCSISGYHDNILQTTTPQLEELYMDFNTLLSLTTRIITKSLRILDLSASGIKHVQHDFLLEMPRLRVLRLSANDELRWFTSESGSLNSLDLRGCYLNAVPSALLPNLTQLILHGNHLRRVFDDSFENMTNLLVVDLSNNAISRVDVKAFEKIPRVQSVNLAYNTISTMNTKSFVSNYKLRKLFLSHNYFRDVPRFDNQALVYLDMSSCEIDNLFRDCFSLLTNLDELDLSRNYISKLPDNLMADNLKTLDLSHCYISSLNNQTFAQLPSLRNLNLAGNRLTSNIKPSYFHDIDLLRLDDNPWRCDCSTDLRDLFEWLMFLNTNPSRLRCQTPENVEGLIWSSACEKEWYPEASQKDTMWWYSVALIGAMILMLFAVWVIRRIYQKKEERLREIEEQERNEARERLRQMRLAQREAREAENRNAPDPRELQRPPSYTEAMMMSASANSLTGSRQSLSNTRSPGKSDKKRRRRKRRRDKGESSTEEMPVRRARDSESEEEASRQAMESDF